MWANYNGVRVRKSKAKVRLKVSIATKVFLPYTYIEGFQPLAYTYTIERCRPLGYTYTEGF